MYNDLTPPAKQVGFGFGHFHFSDHKKLQCPQQAKAYTKKSRLSDINLINGVKIILSHILVRQTVQLSNRHVTQLCLHRQNDPVQPRSTQDCLHHNYIQTDYKPADFCFVHPPDQESEQPTEAPLYKGVPDLQTAANFRQVPEFSLFL